MRNDRSEKKWLICRLLGTYYGFIRIVSDCSADVKYDSLIRKYFLGKNAFFDYERYLNFCT